MAKRMSNNNTNNQQTTVKKKSIFFTISFYGNESAEFGKKLKKICEKYSPFVQVNIALKKTLTLKGILLPIKKGIEKREKTSL